MALSSLHFLAEQGLLLLLFRGKGEDVVRLLGVVVWGDLLYVSMVTLVAFRIVSVTSADQKKDNQSPKMEVNV